MKILYFSGSPSEEGLNQAALKAFAAVGAARGHQTDFAHPMQLPLLGEPETEKVLQLRSNVSNADAIVFSVPEYNYSIPGSFKNALDWLSRPAYEGALSKKRVATMSASPSLVGGARGQNHLRQILFSLGAWVFPHPEVALGRLHQSIENGEVHGPARTIINEYAGLFFDWVENP